MKTLNIDSRKAVCTRQRSVISLLSKHILQLAKENKAIGFHYYTRVPVISGAAPNWLPADKVDYSPPELGACLTQIYNSSGFCLLSKYLHRYHLYRLTAGRIDLQ
jgi:hypothetical protein